MEAIIRKVRAVEPSVLGILGEALGVANSFDYGDHGRAGIAVGVIDPTPSQTGQTFSVAAFPWDEAPRYLLRDRDRIYGAKVKQRIKHMGIDEVTIAFRSPWQSPYVERLIGSIRRECLDHMIILTEAHLHRILTSYLEYYHESRTLQSLEDNAPVPRIVEPPDEGNVIWDPQVGGLHHRYRRAA